MEITTIGLLGILITSILYLSHRIGKLEGCVKNIEKRLNELEHQLRQLVKGIGGSHGGED